MPILDRRSFLLGSAAAAAAGSASSAASPIGGAYAAMYGPVNDRFFVPGAPLSQIDGAFLRTAVRYVSTELPGTIVVDPQSRFLYHVQEGGIAIRYGVGVGRTGFGWSGTATIKDKQEWPDWYPPAEMLERQPELWDRMRRLRSDIGMPGGPGNPLGARAMYLWQGNKDTLFRIHGTFEPWTIGTNVSSGCIRMINQRCHRSLQPNSLRDQGRGSGGSGWPGTTRPRGLLRRGPATTSEAVVTVSSVSVIPSFASGGWTANVGAGG